MSRIESFREEFAKYRNKMTRKIEEADSPYPIRREFLRFTPQELSAFSAQQALLGIKDKNRIPIIFGAKRDLMREITRRLELIEQTDVYRSFVKKLSIRAGVTI